MAQAIIDSTETRPAPKRLLLGREAHGRVRAALLERLAALDAQQEIAYSTEIDA